MQHVIRNTLAFVAFCFLRFAFCVSGVYAQEPAEWSDNCKKTVNGVEVATLQGFECIFRNIVRILTPVAILALFIMLIVGAFQMITAGGEAKAVQKARNTLTYAIFGLVLFVGIWFILQLIKTITGVDVTIFKIPSE